MISVVTLTFNNESELKETLQSLLVPAHPELWKSMELIIVNGGSCPKTKEFLNTLTTPFPLKVIQEPDRGIADGFNKGVRNATGEAVIFLNSGDTLLEKDYIPRADRYLKENPSMGFVHGKVIFIDRLCGDMVIAPRLCSLGRGMPYYHQTMVVRRNIFDQLGPIRLEFKIAMDFEFVCRMEKAGIQGFYDQGAPVVKMNGHGVSATQEDKSLREAYQAIDSNGLMNGRNLRGWWVRYFFYRLRTLKFMEARFFREILIFLKRWKNS